MATITAGGPSLVLGNNLRQNQISMSGVFWTFNPVATTTLQANAAGTGTMPFNLGQQPYTSVLPFNVVPGGDGPSIYQFTNLRAPVKRNVGTGTFTLAMTDSVNMSVDLSYGDVETVDVNQGLTANFDSISPQNAFIQGNAALTAAQQWVALFGGGPAFFDKDWTSQIDAHSEFTTKVKRAAVGFDGKFGSSSWTWDGYYQYGLTNREQIVNDNRHLNAYNYAIDSLLVNGVPTCRVNTPGGTAGFTAAQLIIAQGCVPINPFGTQPISAAAKAYAFGNLDEQLRYEQQLVALNATGDLFAGFGAGPIQGAIGVEYRKEKGENIGAAPPGTPDAVRTDYLIQYGESFSGNVDVTEGYVETSIPLLRDVPAAKRLDLDIAARESQYKNTGLAGTTGQKHTHNLTTWKVSGIWDPVEWLRVRASRSRDARAANFRELYYGQKLGAGGLFGFSMSAILRAAAPSRAMRATGASRRRIPPRSASFGPPLVDSGTGQSIGALSKIDQKFQSTPDAPVINIVGQTGTGNNFLSDNQATPKWTANLSATFNHGPISLTGQGRYFSSGIMDYLGAVPPATPPPTGRTLSTNEVPSYAVFSLSGSYMFSNMGPLKSLQIFGVINNVFDKTPPVAVGGGAFGPGNTNGGTNAVFFDTLGRSYRLGLRTTF